MTRFIPGRWNAVCRLISWLACSLATVHCSFQVGVPAPLAADSLSIDPTGLPLRTLVASPPPRPVPRWLQTHLRIGHLPGYDERMVKEF